MFIHRATILIPVSARYVDKLKHALQELVYSVKILLPDTSYCKRWPISISENSNFSKAIPSIKKKNAPLPLSPLGTTEDTFLSLSIFEGKIVIIMTPLCFFPQTSPCPPSGFRLCVRTNGRITNWNEYIKWEKSFGLMVKCSWLHLRIVFQKVVHTGEKS